MIRQSVLLWLCVLLGAITRGQGVTSIHYSDREIGSGYIYDLDQGVKGELLIASDNGLITFDGRVFTRFSELDAVAEDFVTAVATSEDVVTLGHLSKGISSKTDGQWNPSSNRLLENSRVLCLEELRGLIYLSQANGNLSIVDESQNVQILLSRAADPVRQIIRVKDELVVISQFMIATMGVLDGKAQIVDSLNVAEGIAAACVDKARRQLYAVTRAGKFKIYSLRDGLVEDNVVDNKMLEKVVDGVSSMAFDVVRKRVWVGTKGKGLLSFRASPDSLFFEEQLMSPTDIQVENIECLFIDLQGNLWIGGFGEGLSMLPVNGPRVYVPVLPITSSSLLDRWIYVADGKHIVRLNPTSLQPHDTVAVESLPSRVKILGSFQSSLIIAGNEEDLYTLDPVKNELVHLNELFDSRFLRINSVKVKGARMFICTESGLYILEHNTTRAFNISNGLSSNRVLCVDQDNTGKIYIGHDGNGVDILEDEQVSQFPMPEGLQSARVNTLNFVAQEIWFSVIGRGLFRMGLENKTVEQFGASNELESDYINAAFTTIRDEIYVLTLNSYSFATTKDASIDFWTRRVEATATYPLTFQYLGNSTLVGTNRGLYRFSDYIPSYAKRVFPVDFHSVKINGFEVVKYSKANLDYGFHDLQVEFSTVSFYNNQRQFEYRLEGFDEDWRTTSSEKGFANYSNLGPGEYTFIVRVLNRPNTAITFPVSISKPIWQKPWFYLLVLIAIALVGVGLARTREQFHKKQKLLLSTEVRKKTALVRSQNKLIKQRSDEIEASIRYASQIQGSMLSGRSDLLLRFPGSFLFYQPKDIVSGDYYWIKTKGDEMYVVAADCTGHGVPGAMMSMIGTVHLNSILFQEDIESPGQILARLDTKLSRSLSQTPREGTTDGMDISILKINLLTNQTIFAGAMHSLWHISDGDIKITRGTRRWIGGTSGIDINVNDFEENTLKPEKGEMLVIFSDGMIDQFGGPLNKKMKSERLMKILNLSLEELDSGGRERKIKQEFEKWRGQNEQTDDVLVIGIQF